MLKDAEIRVALVEHLNKRSPKPTYVAQELHVHNGNAIADVVAFYKHMHCYEIKGETDSVGRVLKQSEVYSHSFPKLTLVLTPKHVNWAMKNLPEYWGIMIANEEIQGRVTLRYERPALNNPEFEADKAFMMLWRQELLDVSARMGIVQRKSNNRNEFAKILGSRMSKQDALAQIQGTLVKRFIEPVQRMRYELKE